MEPRSSPHDQGVTSRPFVGNAPALSNGADNERRSVVSLMRGVPAELGVEARDNSTSPEQPWVREEAQDISSGKRWSLAFRYYLDRRRRRRRRLCRRRRIRRALRGWSGGSLLAAHGLCGWTGEEHYDIRCWTAGGGRRWSLSPSPSPNSQVPRCGICACALTDFQTRVCLARTQDSRLAGHFNAANSNSYGAA